MIGNTRERFCFRGGAMEELEAIQAVYSYYFPEVRRLITELTREYPHNIFLQSIHPGLDDFHIPIIEEYVDFQGDFVSGLREFPFRYPTAGSSEGIREILTFLQRRGVRQIYVFKGEYEGYKETAKTRGIDTTEVDWGVDLKSLKKGYWFLSNPSARDGNIISNEVVR